MTMNDSLDPKRWVNFAQNDFELAEMGASRFRPPIESVCYLCQQSAEKILKAYNIANGGVHKKNHTLNELLKTCEQYSPDFNNLAMACARLKPFLTAARYPTMMDITEHDMKQAIEDAGQILEFTKAKLKEMGCKYDLDSGYQVIASTDIN